MSNTFDLSNFYDSLGDGVHAIVPLDDLNNKFPNANTNKPPSSSSSSSSSSGPSISSSSSLSHSGPLSTSSVSHSGSVSTSGVNSNFQLNSNLNSNLLSGINNGIKGIQQGFQSFQDIVNPSNIVNSLSNYNPLSGLNQYSLPSLDLGTFSHSSSFNVNGANAGNSYKKPIDDPQASYNKVCCS